jgi:hypothetical protein
MNDEHRYITVSPRTTPGRRRLQVCEPGQHGQAKSALLAKGDCTKSENRDDRFPSKMTSPIMIDLPSRALIQLGPTYVRARNSEALLRSRALAS